MTDWQPIETAPKDGTLIIIREASGRVRVAKWCAPGYNEPDWWVQLSQSGTPDAFPTMDVIEWSPLPEPPKTNLIHRLETAEGPSRELDMEIELFLENAGFDEPAANWPEDCPAYTASLDAAVSLVPEGIAWAVQMPGQRTTKGARAFADTWPIGMREDINPGVFAPTPALALCIAALKSREIG